MKILITNDDSINARGIRALIDCASEFGDIIAVAPLIPQSGKSSAISIESPLRMVRTGEFNGVEMWGVNGTPVDCVKLALHLMDNDKPDLILSGINHGSNSGNAITYSGTMGAVLEGCMNKIPSIGFSLLHHSLAADFSLSRSFISEIIAKAVENPLPIYTALNVNIPSKIVPQGIRVCRAARGHWSEEYEEYIDPHGKPFYMLSGRFVNEETGATDTDEYWLTRNYISVVPVCPDMSQTQLIQPFTEIYNQ